MKQRTICKGLAVAVILLFLGLAIQPSVAVETETEIDIEPKDYLFQTIIDISNNPDVKNLLEQYKYDLIEVDIDRSDYRKLFLRNPRLIFNILFTKPSMSVEYLNKYYNNGVEITNILGEDKALEIIENVKVTDTKLFDELNNIISKNEELTGRLETIKEMNKEINLYTQFWENYPIICSILGIMLLMFLGTSFILGTIMEIFREGSIIYYLFLPGVLVSLGLFFGTLSFMWFGLECKEYYE